MNLDRVNSGRDVPNDFNVVIEIPMNGDPIKYELDKETGALFVDRFMSTAMHYPCNYGYIPHTLSGDGDPVDVLVVTPYPLIPGVVVRCRPVGMLKMIDEAGSGEKLLAVPVDKLITIYRKVQSPRDLPEITLNQIAHCTLQGSRGRQMGQGRRLGGPGRGQESHSGRRQAPQGGQEEAALLKILSPPAFGTTHEFIRRRLHAQSRCLHFSRRPCRSMGGRCRGLFGKKRRHHGAHSRALHLRRLR
jgi:inorganic pyrophosphatase